jgi:uracil-DNA glycosylase
VIVSSTFSAPPKVPDDEVDIDEEHVCLRLLFLRSSLMMFRGEAVLLLGTCVCWVVVETRRGN